MNIQTRQDSKQVIVGQPYKPPKALKPYQTEIECTNKNCAWPCHCNVEGMQIGHLMRHHAEPHTHSKQVQPADGGSGWLERKADGEIIYHTPWLKPHTPFRNTTAGKNLTPKPRIETSAKAFARMQKECNAAVRADADPRLAAMTGKSACAGYKIVATNGYWALLEPGKSEANSYDWLGDVSKSKPSVLHDAELWNVLQCATTISAEKRRYVALMMLDTDTVTVYASDSDVGDYMGTASGKTAHVFAVGLDWKYLEMALGCWPLTGWFKDEESLLVFEPADKTWRFVLMPMRGELDKVKKTVRKMQADMQAERKSAQDAQDAQDAQQPVWGGY